MTATGTANFTGFANFEGKNVQPSILLLIGGKRLDHPVTENQELVEMSNKRYLYHHD
jgi:hypothetical protein